MKRIKNLKSAMSGVVLSVALVATSVAGVSAFGSPDRGNRDHHRATPSNNSFSRGPQAKPPVEPGTVDAEETEKLGETQEVKTDKNGKLNTEMKRRLSLQPKVYPAVSSEEPLNYCYKNLVYSRIINHTGSTQSIQVTMFNKGGEHKKYAKVAAGETAYVAFYGVEGEYATYLYHWDGSNYKYVDDKSGENICRVAVTRTKNSDGKVELRIQNTGTAYATQKTSQLAPNAGVGEATGTHHDKPVAGGEPIYRSFDVSGGVYGIVSDTYGATISPYLFNGEV